MGGNGILTETKESQGPCGQAIFHYNQSGNLRSADPDQTIKQFNHAIDLCNDVIQLITPASKIQKDQIIIAFSGWIITFILFIDKIFRVF